MMEYLNVLGYVVIIFKITNKMKTALLLSGLPRNVKEGYDEYFSKLITKYNADVYLHYWEDGEYEEVLKVYNPKKYINLKPFSFESYKEGINSLNDSNARPDKKYDVSGNFYSLPMFFGWQSVFNLIDSQIEYDCIIRSRYDLSSYHIPGIQNLDLSKINVSNYHWSGNEVIDDNILITNQDLSKSLLLNIFDDFIDLIRENKNISFPERNFTDLLLKKNLYKHIHKSNELPFKLLREFKVWY